MQRVTVSLDDNSASEFDALVAERGYASRSEAIRDLVRRAVDARRLEQDDTGLCVANLSYVYDHHNRTVARRIVDMQHDRHALVISTTHVHLDHDNCLESTLLKGSVAEVRALSDAIQAERGVRYGAVNLFSATTSD